MMKSILFTCIALLGTTAVAAPEKIRVMPTDDRKAYLMPHWENWQWKSNGTTFDVDGLQLSLSGGQSKLVAVTRKALLETGMHMGVAGMASDGGELLLRIAGLSPGPHTVATYHNEGPRFNVTTDLRDLRRRPRRHPQILPLPHRRQ